MSDDGVLALDAAEFDRHVQAFVEGLAPHGVDGALVVLFKGKDSGVSVARCGPVTLPELRELALLAIKADQRARAS